MAYSCITLLSVILALLLIDEHRPTSAVSLPSIWNEKQDGQGENAEKSYRITAELMLIESNKTYLIEEWASSEEQLFRLDISELPLGTRTTILTRLKTKEIFKYKPFNCKLLKSIRDGLNPSLVGIFVNDDSSFIPTGIGSIWLHGLHQQMDAIKHFPSDPTDNNNNGDKQKVLRNYDKFVAPSSKQYSWTSVFLFHNSRSGLDGPESLSSIEVGPEAVESNNPAISTMAHIKILEIENPFLYENNFQVFELPLGYGCQRSIDGMSTFSSPLPNYTESLPQLMHLNIISLQPINDNDNLEKWKTHSGKVRILTGTIYGTKYIVVEKNDYVQKQGYKNKKGNKASLRRFKSVWSFNEGDTRKILTKFEVDESLGRCLDYSEKVSKKDFSVDFSISELGGEGKKLINILTMDTKLLKSLLTTFYGYHLIRDNRQLPTTSNSEVVYEYRDDKFEMRDSEERLVWSGPVSFIFRHEFLERKAKSKCKNKLDSRVTLVMQFYSNTLDSIKAKIQINLLDYRLINQAYFHRELNVEVCYKLLNTNHADQSINLLKSTRGDLANAIDFSINYLIGSQFIQDRLSSSDQSESMIYEEFLKSLETSVPSLNDLLRLVDIKFDYGNEMLTISGKLLEKPAVLNYWSVPETKFNMIKLSRDEQIFTEFKSDLEGCAKSCQHYNCFMFSFNSKGPGQCDILLHNLLSYADVTEYDQDFDMFYQKQCSDNSSAVCSSTDSMQIIHDLRRLIELEEGDESELVLNVEYFNEHYKSETIRLVPTSIKSDHFKLKQDLLDLQSEVDANLDGSQKNVDKRFQYELDDSNFKIRPEYRVVEMNKRFTMRDSTKLMFPIQQAEHMDYETCEELCDEFDCKSFSHCKLLKTCLISQLYLKDEIRQNSQNEDLCFILARDYLSKFQTLELDVAQEDILSDQKPSDLVKYASTESDCATNCMEANGINCKSFYFCPTADDNNPGPPKFNCFLRAKHMANKLKRDKQAISSGRCSFHIRSYLVDFDKFYQKSLADVENTLVLSGLSAENCAIECKEKSGTCLGFEICRSETKATCAIISYENRSRLQLIKEFVQSDRCTTFVLSRESELYNNLTLATSSDGIVAIDSGFQEATGPVSWFGALALFSVGIAMGCFMVQIIKDRWC